MHAGERFKSRLKRALRAVAESAPQAPDARRVILTYHSVGHRGHEMNVSPDAFRDQMQWLTDHYPVIPLARAVEGDAGVAITFDDGYSDNLHEAAPILDALRVPATVFFVAGRAGGVLAHDDSARDSSRLMSWDELRELVDMGWDVGGHTMTHARLATLDTKEQQREITECKQTLEDALGRTVNGFAYPYGSSLDYTASTKRLVRDAGYAYAVSNRYGVNETGHDRFALRRVWIDRSDSRASFAAKVDGRLDRLAWIDSRLGIHARRFANRMLRSA